jgi:hypothetical protein
VVVKSVKICLLWHIGQSPLTYRAVIVEISAFYTPNPLSCIFKKYNFEQALGNKIRELVAWV